MLETAVFKKLAHNDTGLAKGHQGGIVIPKVLSEFFPPLPKVLDPISPTVDVRLKADLFINGERLKTVETRYQHQTWGGKRPAERRLTDNLGAIRNAASENDILLFKRDILDDLYIEIHLITQGTSEYKRLNNQFGVSRWGVVDENNRPVTLTEIRQAEEFVENESLSPNTPFCSDRQTVELVSVRKARDRAFRKKVLELYDFRCAFTGRKFVSPNSHTTLGLDAAHVVPVESNGSDHPANGIPLTKELHWAFDKGLVGVTTSRKIFVPRSVSSLAGNEFLRDLHDMPIREAILPNLRVMEEALHWHRTKILVE